MSEPILYSPTGNTQQITAGVLGPGGTVNGSPTFVPAQFGNGVLLDLTTEYIEWLNIVGFDEPSSIGFWWKPTYDSSDTTIRYLCDGPSGGRIVFCAFNESGNTGKLLCKYRRLTNIVTSVITFSANDLIHIGMTADFNGIEGGPDTTRLYMDGILIGQGSASVNIAQNEELRLGVSVAATGTINSAMDNVKCYPFVKTDWSDRFDERAGLNDQSLFM